ncbi:MAG: hypothetical protein CTY29_05320 [Methylobacter sp.]|nr:MAG: hypothetical protein CTY29_05320 [Methylobacter sp.]
MKNYADFKRQFKALPFIMNGGNIVALQKLLGHSSLNITMRYAHLASSYMDDVINQNPLSSGNNVVIV